MINGYVDKVVKLFEFATNLFESQANEKQKYLDETYQCASEVYKDYIQFLSDLRTRVLRARKSEPIVRFIEERRRQFLPLRKKLDAVVSKRLQKNPASKFEVGVMGLMTGSVTVFDKRYFRIYRFDSEYRIIRAHEGRHTVLDILNELKKQEGGTIASIRQDILKSIDSKMRCLAIAWKDISEGYAGYEDSKSDFFKQKSRRMPKTSEAIPAMLEELQAQSEAGHFNRLAAIDFEKFVGGSVPCLMALASEIREIIHDLDNREPNVTLADLHEKLREFKTEFTRIFKRPS